MARDVEFNITASDRSGSALASAEAKFAASQQRIRKQSEKTGSHLGDSLTKGVSKAAPGLLDSITGVFTKGGIAGGDLLVAGIAVAAPVIGATLSAAVIGAAGAGGLIGGIMLAARDPRVKAAGAQLGQTLLSGLQQDAAPFVAPLLRNIAKVEDRFEQMRSRIQRIFATSSTFLDPLTDSVLNGVDDILRGFDALVAKAGPLMKSLGQGFELVGDSIGNAAETIAGGSDEAADAVLGLSKALAATIEAAGYTIRGLTELYGVISYIPGKINEGVTSLYKWLGVMKEDAIITRHVAGQSDEMAAATEAVGQQAAEASAPLASFTDRVNDLADAGRSAFDATTSLGEATDRTRDALAKNGKTLDASTEKGRANRQALSGLATALLGQYNATVKVNGEGLKSNAVAASNREQFIKLATQFGLSKGAARDLATQMGLIPAKKSVAFFANTHDAKARIDALKDQLGGIRDRTVNVNVQLNQSRLNKVENTLNRLNRGGVFAGGSGWAASDGGSGVSRTGGPAQVQVANDVHVSLDGAPFYAMTTRVVRSSAERDAWRQKVGAR